MTADGTLERTPDAPPGEVPAWEAHPVGAPVGPRSVPELAPATVRRPAAPRPEPGGPGTTRSVLPGAVRSAVAVAAVLGASVLVGRVAGTPGRALVHNRMLPWILGRSLGTATFVALTATVVLGLWLRHPLRARVGHPLPESILWGHLTLAACTVVLLAGHLTSLALDRYAGVGWTGVFVPWGAQFRPTGVAVGTLGFYLLVVVVGTAALAGSIGRAVWFPVHAASVVVFCLCLVHGVLTGSDRIALRWLYVASGGLVLLLQFTRWLAGTLDRGPAVVDA